MKHVSFLKTHPTSLFALFFTFSFACPSFSQYPFEKQTLVSIILSDKKDSSSQKLPHSTRMFQNKLSRYDAEIQELEDTLNIEIERHKNARPEEMASIEVRIFDLQSKVDRYKQSRKEVIENQRKDAMNNDFFVSFWRKSKNEVGELYWEAATRNGFNVLNNFGIQGTTERGSIYTELVSSNMESVRIHFGTVLATSSNDSSGEKQSLQRFIGGGGNAILSLDLPVYYWRRKAFTSFFNGNVRLAGDVPALGTGVQNATGNGNLALEWYLSVASEDRKFMFFCYFWGGWTVGSKDFYQNLAIEDKPFWYGQMNLGFNILQSFRISVNFPVFSTHGKLMRTAATIGTQLQQF